MARRQRRVSALLLLAMFSVAARYSDHTAMPKPPLDSSIMWGAGDDYLDQAKVILDATYASSKPSTVQALLLMAYREVGIGAMAQAWIYLGMAIRMAQDLGLHRRADDWVRVGLGGRLFGEWELSERRRIWSACVVMDKHVSAFIGQSIHTIYSNSPQPSVQDVRFQYTSMILIQLLRMKKMYGSVFQSKFNCSLFSFISARRTRGLDTTLFHVPGAGWSSRAASRENYIVLQCFSPTV